MPRIHCLEPTQLEKFLHRRRAHPAFPLELSLAESLVLVLRKANEFVPSAAGSILIDDPLTKHRDARSDRLVFVAAFGEKSSGLVGQSIPASKSIAGHVYTSGTAHRSDRVDADKLFFPGVDRTTDYHTASLIAIPIRIEQQVCGVLELINRIDGLAYTEQEQTLLEIFAGYISITIQNVLDARHAQEIAKRDNLTGLFNDRYLHIALAQIIGSCRESNQDLSVIFFDLDRFKLVNDTHGHLAGSQVLREIGGVLDGLLPRHEGSVAARYGGDEFVVLAPGLDLEAAVELAEDIRTSIQDATFCSEASDIQPEALHLKHLSCSVGVATLSRHIESDLDLEAAKSRLLRLADAAMYVAKETGRNRSAVAGEPIRRRR